ncbi:MAG TPA: hypothetical protein VK622_13240 [Puia sp.]|nr:hypothetical protein [Puia sp.]
MAVIKKFENSREGTLKKFKLDTATLSTRKVSKLSDVAVAKKLGVDPGLLTAAMVLSPNKPRSGKKFLSMFSAMMVLADPRPSNNIALFSSAFPTAVNPAIQVEFDPITAGKKHLVEFNISLNEPNKVYKFRVFQYPTATFQDISISGSQSISVLVNPASGITTYGAEIMQLNTKAEECGWIFHSLTITSIS